MADETGNDLLSDFSDVDSQESSDDNNFEISIFDSFNDISLEDFGGNTERDPEETMNSGFSPFSLDLTDILLQETKESDVRDEGQQPPSAPAPDIVEMLGKLSTSAPDEDEEIQLKLEELSEDGSLNETHYTSPGLAMSDVSDTVFKEEEESDTNSPAPQIVLTETQKKLRSLDTVASATAASDVSRSTKCLKRKPKEKKKNRPRGVSPPKRPEMPAPNEETKRAVDHVPISTRKRTQKLKKPESVEKVKVRKSRIKAASTASSYKAKTMPPPKKKAKKEAGSMPPPNKKARSMPPLKKETRDMPPPEKEKKKGSNEYQMRRVVTEMTKAEIRVLHAAITTDSSGPETVADELYTQICGQFRDIGMLNERNFKAAFLKMREYAVAITQSFFPDWKLKLRPLHKVLVESEEELAKFAEETEEKNDDGTLDEENVEETVEETRVVSNETGGDVLEGVTDDQSEELLLFNGDNSADLEFIQKECGDIDPETLMASESTPRPISSEDELAPLGENVEFIIEGSFEDLESTMRTRISSSDVEMAPWEGNLNDDHSSNAENTEGRRVNETGIVAETGAFPTVDDVEQVVSTQLKQFDAIDEGTVDSMESTQRPLSFTFGGEITPVGEHENEEHSLNDENVKGRRVEKTVVPVETGAVPTSDDIEQIDYNSLFPEKLSSNYADYLVGLVFTHTEFDDIFEGPREAVGITPRPPVSSSSVTIAPQGENNTNVDDVVHSEPSTSNEAKKASESGEENETQMTESKLQSLFAECSFRYMQHLRNLYRKKIREIVARSLLDDDWKKDLEEILKDEANAEPDKNMEQ